MHARPSEYESSRLGLLGLALAAFTAAGCGGALAPVNGRVLVGGQPVPGGVVQFHSETGSIAVGQIQPDGSFTLTTRSPGDGAVVGRHKVVVQVSADGPGDMVRFSAPGDEHHAGKNVPAPGVVAWLVPPEYSQAGATPLTAEVTRGRNDLIFDIQPAPPR